MVILILSFKKHLKEITKQERYIMNTQRFKFALDNIAPNQWGYFEKISSKFLAAEFGNIRTMASNSGDGGRDSILFSPSNDQSVIMQYSITIDWKTKINKTANQIKRTYPNTVILIYITNKEIGPKADSLKSEMRQKYDLILDIRDQSWFLERMHIDVQREMAVEELVKEIVDPILASKEIISNKGQALSSIESRAAFVYLGLQWADDTREKGLTKLSFEALVRAVLRGTNPENRLKRGLIKERVRGLIPTHPPAEVDKYTDLAIDRLTKKYIRHYKADDEFCITFEERIRLDEMLVLREQQDRNFQLHIKNVLESHISAVLDEATFSEVVNIIRICLEKYLLGQGELFISSIQKGFSSSDESGDLKNIIIKVINEQPKLRKLNFDLLEAVKMVVLDVLTNSESSVREYLRELKDAYTLFAFLRETTDVQSAVVKMFSSGDIWLDTNIILPLFAETLFSSQQGQFTKMLKAANEAGLTLHITRGVLEECERHMNRSLLCARQSEWRGNIPFLFSAYVMSGLSMSGFSSWLEQFRGDTMPEQDIADYLKREFGICITSLDKEMASAPAELKDSVKEIFFNAREKKRLRKNEVVDPLTEGLLVDHDMENYLGVIMRRSQEKITPFGYNSWWLTLYRTAWGVDQKLIQYVKIKPPESPTLSPDFLLNYLVFGPLRSKVSKDTEKSLPVMIDRSFSDLLPKDLTDIAQKVRAETKDMPEYIIQRKVRDELIKAKKRLGSIAEGGIAGVEEKLKQAVIIDME